MYGGVEVEIHLFFTSAIVGGEWLASRPGRFTTGERARDTHWVGDLVGSRAGLDVVKGRNILSIAGLKLRSIGLPPLSQWLYRLYYPGSVFSLLSLF
jgi:hypothetical protein